jgi:hypothetical protein
MSDQREMRKVFGPKRERITGNCRKLLSEELQNWFSSLNVIPMIKWRGR